MRPLEQVLRLLTHAPFLLFPLLLLWGVWVAAGWDRPLLGGTPVRRSLGPMAGSPSKGPKAKRRRGPPAVGEASPSSSSSSSSSVSNATSSGSSESGRDRVRRALHIWAAAVGLGVNELVCQGLKRMIRQPRPAGSSKSGYGMPSSHAQYMGFLGVALLLLLPRAQPGMQQRQLGRNVTRRRVLLAYAVLLLAVCASRLVMHVHTPAQVGVGVVVGAVFGWAWMDWMGEVGVPQVMAMYEALLPLPPARAGSADLSASGAST